jgi:hypothetical protein
LELDQQRHLGFSMRERALHPKCRTNQQQTAAECGVGRRSFLVEICRNDLLSADSVLFSSRVVVYLNDWLLWWLAFFMDIDKH